MSFTASRPTLRQNLALNDYETLIRITTELLDRIKKVVDIFGKSQMSQKIETIKNEFSFLLNVYDISNHNYPLLGQILLPNYDALSDLMYAVEQAYTEGEAETLLDLMDDKNALNQSISFYHTVMAEESIKIPIKILFDMSAQLAQMLSEADIQEKLPGSINILENFFKQLTTTQKDTKETTLAEFSHFLDRLNTITQNPCTQTSAYLISLAQALNQMDNLDRLDGPAQKNILLVMRETMAKCDELNKSTLKKRKAADPLLFTGKRLSFLSNSSINPSITTQDAIVSKEVNFPVVEDGLIWKAVCKSLDNISTSYLTEYNILYNLAYAKDISFTLCDSVRRTLFETYHFYTQSPGDFSGLLPVLLDDVVFFKESCVNHYNDKEKTEGDRADLLAKDLNIFYQQMKRRHLQIRICALYNSIFCDNTFQSTEEDWTNAYDSVMTLLKQFYMTHKSSLIKLSGKILDTDKEKREFDSLTNTLKHVEILIDNFIVLRSLLEINTGPLLSEKTSQCMIELNNILVKAGINDFAFNIFDRVFEKTIELQENIKILIDHDKDPKNDNFRPPRMRMTWKQPSRHLQNNLSSVDYIEKKSPINTMTNATNFLTPNTNNEIIGIYEQIDLNSNKENIVGDAKRKANTPENLRFKLDFDRETLSDRRKWPIVYENIKAQLTAHNMPRHLIDDYAEKYTDQIYDIQSANKNSVMPFYKNKPVDTMFGPGSRISASESLEQIAKAYDLKRLNVKGKGDCMYLAVAATLQQIQFKTNEINFADLTLDKAAQVLRTMACVHLADDPGRFKFHVTKVKKENITVGNKPDRLLKEDEFDYDKNFVEYLKKILEGDWGDHCQLFALCDKLNLKAVVFNSDDANHPIILGQEDATHIISLGYEAQQSSKSQQSEGWHYQAFLRLDNNAIAPPQKVLDLIKKHENKTDYIRKTPY